MTEQERQILEQSLEGAQPGTSITAPGLTPTKDLSDVMDLLDEIFSEDISYIKGESKSSKPKFNLVDYLKNQWKFYNVTQGGDVQIHCFDDECLDKVLTLTLHFAVCLF